MHSEMSPAALHGAAKACTALAVTALVCAGLALFAAPVRAAESASVARGRYLVENIGMCSDCHSARDAKGQIVKATALQGAPVGFKPLMEMPWADVAPPIAGLPAGWTKAQMATFLQTGRRPDGSEPRPPMPPYRLSKADAAAAADYLASLK
ncbi:c-type cytochrome [Alsobacter sp. R-9]